MDKKLSTRNISNMVIVARTLALISIVSAHIIFTQTTPLWISEIYKLLAPVGVVTYFIISGYYYHIDKYGSFFYVLKKKLKTIGIPWLVLGSIGYFYNAILSKDISIVSYLKFILGNGSYLYFLIMLFLCFIIFYFFKSKIFCIVAILLNILSLELTAMGVLEPVTKALHITDYLNIFNWIGFFAFGVLLQRVDTDKLYNAVKKLRVLSIMVFVLFFVVLFITKIKTGYFSYVGWIYEFIGAVAILAVSSFDFLNIKLIRKVSNDSFTVYLIHFMVIGVFDRLYNIALPLQLFANIIVICISFVAIELCMFISKKIKIEKIVCVILGVRGR